MSGISDEFMQEELKGLRRYTLVLLRAGPERGSPGADKVVWEHGRRNFQLRRDGLLNIVCPADGDGTEVAGVCIFSTDLAKTREVMDGDPAVSAGVLRYEAYSIRGFPGDSLSR